MIVDGAEPGPPAPDPFVTHGLRTFEVFGWRVNEGAIQLGLSLGAGHYTWR